MTRKRAVSFQHWAPNSVPPNQREPCPEQDLGRLLTADLKETCSQCSVVPVSKAQASSGAPCSLLDSKLRDQAPTKKGSLFWEKSTCLIKKREAISFSTFGKKELVHDQIPYFRFARYRILPRSCLSAVSAKGFRPQEAFLLPSRPGRFRDASSVLSECQGRPLEDSSWQRAFALHTPMPTSVNTPTHTHTHTLQLPKEGSHLSSTTGKFRVGRFRVARPIPSRIENVTWTNKKHTQRAKERAKRTLNH